jgi:carbonic anhydrase
MHFCIEKKKHQKKNHNNQNHHNYHTIRRVKLQAEREIASFEEDFDNNDNAESNLFMELKNKNKNKKKKAPKKKAPKKNAKPKNAPKKNNKKLVNKPNIKDMILLPHEKLDILMTDYMKISSPQFLNTLKFPPLELPDGKTVRIKVDKNYYRINDFAIKGENAPPSNLHFWFRMSGRNLYYSTNKEDINVLGAIRIENIYDIEAKKNINDEKLCFKILDNHKSKWKICAPNMSRKKDWICAIRKILNQFDEYCKKTDLADSEVTVLTKKVTQPIILVSQANKMCNEDWDYLKRGSDWECTCKEGKEQSPINLPNIKEAIESPAKPVFKYDEVPKERLITTSEGLSKTQRLRINYENNLLKIKDAEFGRIVTLDGAEFLGNEIQFHTPSEHTINGKVYPMEMQIIHQGLTQGDIGKQVVLSFLFEKKPGAYNKFIDDIDFFNLPNPAFKSREIDNNLYVPKIFYNSKDEDLPIMKDFSFYTYQGSLTSPPCTERTIHYVASQVIPLGSTALTLFKEATRIPDMIDSSGNIIVNTNPSINSRKIQPLNGRKVFHYTQKETCKIPGVRSHRIKKRGHYEKVVKKAVEYFYVNNPVPSRLPGAMVVSEGEAKNYV